MRDSWVWQKRNSRGMRRFGFEGVILVVWKGETHRLAAVFLWRRGFWGWEGMGRILDWEVLV